MPDASLELIPEDYPNDSYLFQAIFHKTQDTIHDNNTAPQMRYLRAP